MRALVILISLCAGFMAHAAERTPRCVRLATGGDMNGDFYEPRGEPSAIVVKECNSMDAKMAIGCLRAVRHVIRFDYRGGNGVRLRQFRQLSGAEVHACLHIQSVDQLHCVQNSLGSGDGLGPKLPDYAPLINRC